MATVDKSATRPATNVQLQGRDIGIRVNEEAQEIKTSGFRFLFALPALDLISKQRKPQVHILDIEFVVRRIGARQKLFVSIQGLLVLAEIIMRRSYEEVSHRYFRTL